MDEILYKERVLKYVELLSSYLNSSTKYECQINEEEMHDFYKFSKQHSLRALLYQAIVYYSVNCPRDLFTKLEECYFNNVRKVVLYDKEREEVFNFLNNNRIDFLPLKGTILSNCYPSIYLREFSDSDILFSSREKSVKSFFLKRGYNVESYGKTNHDVYLKKPFFNFEMHRELFSDKRFDCYFKNYLKESPVKENFEHYLNNEDFYIYFTAHTFKHFDRSGCGIRTIIDYYLYIKTHTLNFEYINKELEKIDLVSFSKRIANLSFKLFDNQKLDKEEENMLLYIASSGTYGSLQNSAINGVKKNGRIKYLLLRVFPPFFTYKRYYPWAYKCPLLIPVAWILRLFRILFNNSKRAITEIKIISEQKNLKK